MGSICSSCPGYVLIAPGVSMILMGTEKIVMGKFRSQNQKSGVIIRKVINQSCKPKVKKMLDVNQNRSKICINNSQHTMTFFIQKELIVLLLSKIAFLLLVVRNVVRLLGKCKNYHITEVDPISIFIFFFNKQQKEQKFFFEIRKF